MKNYLLLLFLAFSGWFATPASAQGDYTMIVETKAGETVKFHFNTKPVLTFAGVNVDIASTGEKVQYPMNDVAQVKFDKNTTGINDATANDVHFTFTNDMLAAEGLTPGSKIAIYGVNGTLLTSANTNAQGKAKLSTASLNTGVYIVKTEKITYKFVKK